MSAREWIDKDFYADLGVSSDASAETIKKAYRKLARELHPDANPGDSKAEQRFKEVSEAYGVLGDAEKRREYDEARKLFASGGFRPGSDGGGFGGFGQPGGTGGFDINDLFAQQSGNAGSGGINDLLGGLFGSRAGGPSGPGGRPPQARKGSDVQTQIRVEFAESVHGTTVPLRLSAPTTCGSCHGSGARPGTRSRVCGTCHGSGYSSRSQGAFAFSEPCRDCRGSGRQVDDPCAQCGGDGVATASRVLTVRIPAGVRNGQRIRVAGQGEPGRAGGATGDLYVVVNVTPHQVLGRVGDDLTLDVPMTFPELVEGTTLTVPTLDSTVSLKVPAGTGSGRTFRVRGRGVKRKNATAGDLLVTVHVSVPSKLSKKAKQTLRDYADATAEHDPRAELSSLIARAGGAA